MRVKFFNKEITGIYNLTKNQIEDSRKFEYECMIKNAQEFHRDLIQFIDNTKVYFEYLDHPDAKETWYTKNIFPYVKIFKEISECPLDQDPLDKLSLRAIERINLNCNLHKDMTKD
ncbi:MAG: hypothetical protein H0U57_13000 [Tatlockia sp.]|nr:hypothetical protein [Tatlockia sp.]